MDEDMKEVGRRKTYRSAMINVVANGFIIEIGCQRLVAETPDSLKCLIVDYLNDPIGTEKIIMRKHLSGNSPERVVEDAPNRTATENQISMASQPAGLGYLRGM